MINEPIEKPDWEIESEYMSLAAADIIICGVDEAGRGPLAGPVYAAACILPYGCEIEGLNDSKKLSEKNRVRLFDIITDTALSYAVASASVEEIEELNILNAAMLAMRRAVGSLGIKPDMALIDGNVAREFKIKTATVIRGDEKSMSIAAASVLAKVSRDRYCTEMDAMYPEYGFIRHKGYPTKEHREILMKIGPSPLHRASFLKFLKDV